MDGWAHRLLRVLAIVIIGYSLWYEKTYLEDYNFRLFADNTHIVMIALLEFHPIESPPFQARLWLIFWLPTPNSLLPHNSNFPLQILLYLHPRTKISRHNHIMIHINILKYSWSWRSSLASLRSFFQHNSIFLRYSEIEPQNEIARKRSTSSWSLP